MSDELLPYYQRELIFIRRLAAEFAARYPDRAGALQLSGNRSDDPHVERLIESFALLAGRVHRKIDDEFPEITESFLSLLYPHYLRPIPSMCIAQFEAEPDTNRLGEGYTVDRGATLYSQPVSGAVCKFRTCYPVTLWPVNVASAAFTRAGSLGLGPASMAAFAAARIELRAPVPIEIGQLNIDRLRFYLGGDRQAAHTLYELLFTRVRSIVLRDVAKGARSAQLTLPASAIREVGFSADEGMLPYGKRSFVGYRLLQEYFSFPDKFLFFDLALEPGMLSGFKDRVEIDILFDDFERRERFALLEQAVGPEVFQLGCTPAVNLFERCAEPIRLTHTETEYRVVPDLHFPHATEVYSIDEVTSTAPYSEESKTYEPFYSLRHAHSFRRGNDGQAFWHSTRRGSNYAGDSGTEVWLTLLDLNFRPSQPANEVLTVHVTCTNRDLPERLPVLHQFGEFEVEGAALARCRPLTHVTRAVRPPMRRGLQWRLISHLALNHLSITSVDAFQELLKLYRFDEDPVSERHIAGLLQLESSTRVAPVFSDQGVSFCRGTLVSALFDEDQYVGSGVYLFATVLERFFGLYNTMNSFSQFEVRTAQRKGLVKQWVPRSGEAIVL